MKRLLVPIITAAMLILGTAPAVSADCFVNTRIEVVADGAERGAPNYFGVLLVDGTLLRVYDSTRTDLLTLQEGNIVQICTNFLVNALILHDRSTGQRFVAEHVR